jgi:outer membrane protein
VTKRFIPAALAAIVLAGGASGASAQQKVGFVNTQRVLALTPAVAQVQQTLEREFAATRAGIDSMETRLQTGQQQLQTQGGTLSDAVRQQRTQELQALYGQYQQRGQQAQQAVQQREAQLMQPVLRTVNDAIEAERRAGTFSYLLDAGSNLIVAFDPALDVTDKVITRLGGNPNATPAAPAPATHP